MPTFPIIDTHLHVWNPDQPIRYPWLKDYPVLNKPFLLEDYCKQTSSVQIEQMVFLQCECDRVQSRQEADWITELSKQDPRITGIVPWAPLENGRAAHDDLVAMVKANPLVKGIRRIIQFEADPAFCLRPRFIEGVQMLGELDLHFEICIKGDEQFRNVLQLIQECPGTRFILNHIAKPMIAERILDSWSKLMGEMAAMPNTWCKMSGLVTEADFRRWTLDDLFPFIARSFEAFGPDRTMFGGDWPVILQAAAYPRWVEILDMAIRRLRFTRADVKKLYHDNAVSFYRLPAKL